LRKNRKRTKRLRNVVDDGVYVLLGFCIKLSQTFIKQIKHQASKQNYRKQGILGVLLNMNTGTLSFSLNGEYMGVAF